MQKLRGRTKHAAHLDDAGFFEGSTMGMDEKKKRAREVVAEISRRIREGEGVSQEEHQAFYQAIIDSKDTSEALEKRLASLPKGWQQEFYRTILLPEWKEAAHLAADARVYFSSDGLKVLVSAEVELDGRRWLHVSCSRDDRLPSWNDLKRVKELFVGTDRMAIQVFPKKEKYVDIHPRVLHLFVCLDEDTPVPDFTRGTGSI